MATAKILLLALSLIALLVALNRRLKDIPRSRLYLSIAGLVFFSCLYLTRDLFLNQLPALEDGSLLTATNIISTFWWISLAYLINRAINSFVYQQRLTADGEPSVPMLVQHMVTLLIYLITAMIVLRFVYDQSITAIAAASGAVALVLGYSSRTLLDEVFAGLAMNINAPFEKNDLVQINDEWGYIKDIDWRSITYLDMDQNYVTLANTKVMAAKLRNLDRPNPLTRRTFYFQVEYNAPPKVVIAQAEAAMAECPHIIDHPWNFVSYFDCDEKGMRYKAHFHVQHFDHWYLASDELINSMWYRFARIGIRFAHQRYLNFKTAEDEKKGLPDSAWDEEHWRDLNERFEQVPMFEGMTSGDMEELAKSATAHVTGPPERIIRAGSKRTSMFIIASGAADVFDVEPDGTEIYTASVGESEPLGLMSLLTGTPQRSTIRATEETVAWEISSESLHTLFERKPQVMENIAKAVAKWQAEEDEALKALEISRRQEAQIIVKRANSLSQRIARFFDRSKSDETSIEYTDY